MNSLALFALLGHVLLAPVWPVDTKPMDPPRKTDTVDGYVSAARQIQARCSAYTATGERTRTGTWPVFGTVAVDPGVIPLGTQLHIDSFPGVTFRAEDTGGAVSGARVDIYFPSYAEAIRFGVQSCTITRL